MIQKLPLKGDLVTEFIVYGGCHTCLAPAKQWAIPDKNGELIVNLTNAYGALVIICPDCAGLENSNEHGHDGYGS